MDSTKRDNLVSTISVAIFVLLALGVVIFLYNQNQNLKNELANRQILPTISPSPTIVIQKSASPSASPKSTKTLNSTSSGIPSGY
jgi:hypothetical protein